MKRATPEQKPIFTFPIISIHALVKRATAMVSASPRIRINFNPRPREEGDAAGVALYGTKWISIHALVKRATSISTSIFPFCVISIHALVKRATLAEYKFSLKAVISIHALVKRATLINFDKNASDTISIHALVKRATFCCRHHRLYL